VSSVYNYCSACKGQKKNEKEKRKEVKTEIKKNDEAETKMGRKRKKDSQFAFLATLLYNEINYEK